MKTVIFRLTLMFGLAFLAAGQALRAQQPMVANIPFAFTAGEVTLPAGEYRVEKWTTSGITLRIQSTDGDAMAFVPAIAAETLERQKACKLIFNHYGNQYFLAQVWSAGSNLGRALPKSRKEKEQALPLT